MLTLSIISYAWPLILALMIIALVGLVIVLIMKNRYFSSDQFKEIKNEIASVVSEHNEISKYVDEIRGGRRFNIGKSTSGMHAHLAKSKNTSSWKYRRDRNVADYGSEFVHNAGLQVVRNAQADPIKYLMKYFDIPATEEKLAEVEEVGESISRLENAIANLKKREDAIAITVSPPKYIRTFFLKEFQRQLGLSIPALQIPYPQYKFQYVSAGGNSSQVTSITLNGKTIDTLLETMAEKIKFRQSAAGQRALMTASFRNHIKTRDNFTCQYCSLSVSQEPNLLLEVDHIQPLSKGGLSVEQNLQTLCWRCNRTKSNK